MSRVVLRPVVLFLTVMTIVIAVTIAAGTAGIVTVDIIRGYSNGATYYSKGHLSAITALYRFARTGEERDYEVYRNRIHPTLSTGVAREALDAEDMPIQNSYPFLIQGNNHPDDVAGLAWLYRVFKETPLFSPVLETWALADERVKQIDAQADRLRHLILTEPENLDARREVVRNIERIDADLIRLEETFSLQLGSLAFLLSVMGTGGAGAAADGLDLGARHCDRTPAESRARYDTRSRIPVGGHCRGRRRLGLGDGCRPSLYFSVAAVRACCRAFDGGISGPEAHGVCTLGKRRALAASSR